MRLTNSVSGWGRDSIGSSCNGSATEGDVGMCQVQILYFVRWSDIENSDIVLMMLRR